MGTTPSGTVTFLFTDVAGSTRLWQSDRSGMEASLADHDRLLREAIAANDGVVFATGGDSFSAAFPTAVQAVEAALTAQLALETHEWPGPRIAVRMGVHTGNADERDSNYFGPEVNRAARIMSVGHARQTLLSEATAGLVRDALPDPLMLADLGVHSLKDIERSEHLFEIRHPDLPAVEAPLATASLGGSHLPEQLTSFVGRATELATVRDLIDGSRIVTLTGVGGTGKTRLAIEAGRLEADSFADGAWMAELASVTDPERVLTQIADVWGLRPGEGVSLINVVSTFLATRELLLVVDNCEHVLDTVSRLVGDLLKAGPRIKVLATSRESLGVAGETVYRVPSMAMPDDQVLQSDAVALFLERFRSIRPGYSPTDADIEAIVRACRRLDGIPLGIELAAARLRSMSPVELADRLGESFRILTGGSKTALPRQRTLQATIDWSYDLLESSERRLFRRASCFIGGFDLDAVSAVAGLDKWEVLDIVDQLVDKSLLSAGPGGAATRYRMLEPIRQYAQEELVDEGESEEAHAAHAEYYAHLVKATAPSLRNSDQKLAHSILRLELDNIRAAFTELRESGRIDELLEMSFDLAFFWVQASMQIEGLEILQGVLDPEPDTDRILLSKAWWAVSMLAFNLTDPRSVEYGLRAAELAQEAEDEVALGWAYLMTAAAISGTGGRTDAFEYFERGEELIEQNPGRPWWGRSWDPIFIGWLRLFLGGGNREERLAELDRTLAAAREYGDLFSAAGAMTGAYFLRSDDDDPVALALLEEAVHIFSELGFRHSLGHSLLYWGWMTRERSGVELGESAVARGAEMLAEIGDLSCALTFSSDLIGHLVDSGKIGEALPHLEFSARQARTDASRFAPLVAAATCRAALAGGDVATAATILGYLDAGGTSRGDACREALESVASPEELSVWLAGGARLSDTEALDLVGSWAPTRGD